MLLPTEFLKYTGDLDLDITIGAPETTSLLHRFDVHDDSDPDSDDAPDTEDVEEAVTMTTRPEDDEWIGLDEDGSPLVDDSGNPLPRPRPRGRPRAQAFSLGHTSCTSCSCPTRVSVGEGLKDYLMQERQRIMDEAENRAKKRKDDP